MGKTLDAVLCLERKFPRNLFKTASVVGLACVWGGGAAFATPAYTNIWTGASDENSSWWGVSANWQVEHDAATTTPASAVPTAESLVRLQKSAVLSLSPIRAYAVGPTAFLGGAVFKTLSVEIPEGSTLSLEGADNESWLGTYGWQDGNPGNKVTLDVNGGTLNVSQKMLALQPTMTDATGTGWNRIHVRNGGQMALSGQATLRMWGGESALSSGRGTYTNVIDVLAGSTLELRGGACLDMGGVVNRQEGRLHTGGMHCGAGWVNVTGGTIRSVDPSFDAPIYMASHYDAGIGAYLSITDGGLVDLGGKSLYQRVCNTNVVTVASGGVLTNLSLSVQGGGGTDPRYHNLLDVDGGVAWLNRVNFGTADPGGMKTGARMTFRIRGEDSVVSVNGWSGFNGWYASEAAAPVFFDFRLKAHASRTADFAVKPVRTRMPCWNDGSVLTIPGVWRLSPEGGMQIVHRDSFELLCRNHDGWATEGANAYVPILPVAGATYGGVIGEEMWATNAVVSSGDRWLRHVGYGVAYTFGVTLRDEAKLEDGVALAAPRPRGWLALPKFEARQLDPERVRRISLRLGLEAPEGGALDLDGIVSRLKAAGHDGACKDDAVECYNVRVDLPVDELAANVETDKVLFDFVFCETFGQAVGAQPMTTNALIRAATVEYVKVERGLSVIVK